MNQTKKFIGICVLALFVTGLLVILVIDTPVSQNSPVSTNTQTTVVGKTTSYVTQPTSTPSSTTTPSPSTTTPGTYTMAQVAQHNSGGSCWTAINGNVYDVTSWIGQHPGGSGAILSLCGIDGSAAFNGQHGGQGRPAQELASFQIGTLSN